MRAIQKIKETNPLFQHLDVETFKVISNVSVSILLVTTKEKFNSDFDSIADNSTEDN